MTRKFLGGIWPVLQRELRETARRPANWRLRLVAVVSGILALYYFVTDPFKSGPQLGCWLFAHLHTLLLGLIFVIVPALGADAIARERREGTLGLLFLTSMSAGGIVAGKVLAQSLRVFTLWLAVVPVLAIPFMLGGVTRFDVGCALSLEFIATVLCLAASLLASSIARERKTAFVLAFLLEATFLFLFSQFDFLTLFLGYKGFHASTFQQWWDEIWQSLPIFTGLLNLRGTYCWAGMKTISTTLFTIWECLCLAGPILAVVFLWFIMRFAVRQIERSWQDQVPSAHRLQLRRRLCTPLFQNYFRKHMQRALDRNPIAWLQLYSWKARVSEWGLCLGFIVVECVGIGTDFQDFQTLQCWLLVVLAGACTFAGVNGFMTEKRSGALELLLTTPLQVNSIIYGRSWGLWKQFLPSGLALLVFELAKFSQGPGLAHVFDDLDNLRDLYEDQSEYARLWFELVLGFLALPFCATYFALRVKNLLTAAILSWVALAIPPTFSYQCCIMFDVEGWFGPYVSLLLLTNLGLVLLICFLLRHSLSRRIYSF